ncbi:uncharacterized protein LOC143619409 [Bidens hawaiensis]|uniref:uncharacterized protein LOC143619409 n=1 Tax=Bidens hawaiensis TaxID=980011 RepID=UPI00404AD9AD
MYGGDFSGYDRDVHGDHPALHFLFHKRDAKPHLIRWILLLSEFDIEIKDKNGEENVAADHLSHLEDPKREEIREDEIGDRFRHELIDFVAVEKQGLPWFTYFANYLSTGLVLKGMTTQQRRSFSMMLLRYVWDNPFLFKIGGDRILRRCVTKEDRLDSLRHVHEGLMGGHHGAHATAQKVFDSGFYWPSVVKDAVESVKTCKLRSKWTGPYLVKEVFPYGAVELENPDNGTSWKVNDHCLKHYLRGPEDSIEVEETPLDP